jgi:hypothetical protein
MYSISLKALRKKFGFLTIDDAISVPDLSLIDNSNPVDEESSFRFCIAGMLDECIQKKKKMVKINFHVDNSKRYKAFSKLEKISENSCVKSSLSTKFAAPETLVYPDICLYVITWMILAEKDCSFKEQYIEVIRAKWLDDEQLPRIAKASAPCETKSLLSNVEVPCQSLAEVQMVIEFARNVLPLIEEVLILSTGKIEQQELFSLTMIKKDLQQMIWSSANGNNDADSGIKDIYNRMSKHVDNVSDPYVKSILHSLDSVLYTTL